MAVTIHGDMEGGGCVTILAVDIKSANEALARRPEIFNIIAYNDDGDIVIGGKEIECPEKNTTSATSLWSVFLWPFARMWKALGGSSRRSTETRFSGMD